MKTNAKNLSPYVFFNLFNQDQFSPSQPAVSCSLTTFPFYLYYFSVELTKMLVKVIPLWDTLLSSFSPDTLYWWHLYANTHSLWPLCAFYIHLSLSLLVCFLLIAGTYTSGAFEILILITYLSHHSFCRTDVTHPCFRDILPFLNISTQEPAPSADELSWIQGVWIYFGNIHFF